MGKKLLFSLKKNDFEVEHYRGSGKGGQNRNKRFTCVRIYHRVSGAVAQSCEQRNQYQNKVTAFKRLVETKEFKTWHKIQCAKTLGVMANLGQEVEDMMQDKHLKVECFDNGKWKEL
jgi:protein subunit release factor B